MNKYKSDIMDKCLKTIMLLLVCSFQTITTFASVNVVISDGLEDVSKKSMMENAMSRLLSEINSAQYSKRNINFSKLTLPSYVQESISMLWENSPFECTDQEIIVKCIMSNGGYQFRNIPLMMKPRPGQKFNEDEYQEAVISFNKSGIMESFYLTIDNNLYMKIIKEDLDLTDLRKRQLILDYVEHFRTSYNQKDMKFLKQVFSDDALIITGRVIKQTKDNINLPDKIVYTKQSKEQYLSRLQSVFNKSKNIKVVFDEIKVVRHPTKPNYYGVTLHQGYTSDFYHDDGYLFLLWDFSDENSPKIHVRTWQPDKLNGSKLPEEEVFDLYDFDI